jgi:TolA-binding protein
VRGLGEIPLGAVETKRLLVRLATLTLLALPGCVYFNTFYNAKKYYGEGERLAAEGRSDHGLPPPARAAFEKSIEKSSAVLASHGDSEYADDALLLLGKAHYRLGNYAAAAAALKNLLERHPESEFRREATLWLVRAGREGGDLAAAARAADELQAAGELEPADRVKLDLERAQLALRAEDPAGALEIYREIQRGHPELARANAVELLVARARLEQGDHAGALQDLRVLLGPGTSPRLQEQAAVLMGEAFAVAGRSDEARATYLGLLEGGLADSVAAPIRFALAESYTASGDTRAAVEEFGAAARLWPSTALASRALYHRGLLEWRVLKSRQAAKQTFLEAYLQDPEGATADSATTAARAIHEIQHYEAILSGSERVLAPIPEDEVMATASYLLAELVYTQENDVAGARSLFAGILERYPGSAWTPKVLYTLGWLAERGVPAGAGEAGAPALVHYRRLVDEYPGTEYARYAREGMTELAAAGLSAAEGAAVASSAAEAPVAGREPAEMPAPDGGTAASPAADGAAVPLAPVPAAPPVEESTDAKLMAFSRALPDAGDPLVGIQDRLTARRQGGERQVGRGRAGLSRAELERQLVAEEDARAARDSLARVEGGEAVPANPEEPPEELNPAARGAPGEENP